MNEPGQEPESRLHEIEHTGKPQFVYYFSRDHQRIFAYIFTLLPNRTDAEDVFQKTSLTLWQKFDEFEHERDFCSWACGIAFFTVRNFLRVSGRHRLYFDDDLISTMADERVSQQKRSDARIEALDHCIAKLNNADRDLVFRAYEDGSSIKDIASQMGRSVQTLYNRLNRIRRGLVECVDTNLVSPGVEGDG